MYACLTSHVLDINLYVLIRIIQRRACGIIIGYWFDMEIYVRVLVRSNIARYIVFVNLGNAQPQLFFSFHNARVHC